MQSLHPYKLGCGRREQMGKKLNNISMGRVSFYGRGIYKVLQEPKEMHCVSQLRQVLL